MHRVLARLSARTVQAAAWKHRVECAAQRIARPTQTDRTAALFNQGQQADMLEAFLCHQTETFVSPTHERNGKHTHLPHMLRLNSILGMHAQSAAIGVGRPTRRHAPKGNQEGEHRDRSTYQLSVLFVRSE